LNPEKGKIFFERVSLTSAEICQVKKIVVVACGTSYHAGIAGKQVMEKILGLSVEVEIASEFSCRDPLVGPDTLVIVISQSGETVDTLAALRIAKNKGARVLAVTNVMGSSVAREVQHIIYTRSGPEVAVASTKAHVTQLLVLYLLTLFLAEARAAITAEEALAIARVLKKLPDQATQILEETEGMIKQLAVDIARWEDVFFIGRGSDWAVALEGSLKLKETSYIHAEAYAAGELKHGTMALITEQIPVIALVTQDSLYEKMVTSIKGVKERGAFVIAITFPKNKLVAQVADRTILIPETMSLVAPILAVIPLQLLAYYAATARGCNVDQPRNLVKSVTVE
jgi:glucosamine--fructose-6-phosphate aminotransferase (isomerizing)